MGAGTWPHICTAGTVIKFSGGYFSSSVRVKFLRGYEIPGKLAMQDSNAGPILTPKDSEKRGTGSMMSSYTRTVSL